MRMLALDTEDDSQGTVGIINFYDGDRHTTFRGEPPAIRHLAWNWLNQQAPAQVWACNTEYDLINLCGPWVGKMATIQYIKGGGFLRATWNDARITFYDTVRHWPMSVKQMGDLIGLQKLEVDDETGYLSVPYCRRDTEIVWHFVRRMLERYEAMKLKLKATLPSMALQLFTTQHYPRALPTVPDYERAFFRKGYYGGRVEVYRFRPIISAINHYDVNSLFPTVMRQGPFPDLHHEYTRTVTPDWSREGIADVTVHLPVTRYPGLPMRSPDHELVYPYGTLHGTWAYPEIRQALTDGARILEVHEAIEYRRAKRTPFKSFVEFCYAQRRRAAKGTLDDVYWKLMMNSLYGKFGQNDGLEIISQDRLSSLSTSAGHANVIWSAYVTSLARVHLLTELRKASEVYYTDTDSLFTPARLPTGPELGQMKLEGTYEAVEFMGNKLYTFTASGPHGGCTTKGPHNHVKAKGVPGEGSKQPEAARDFLRNGRCIYRRPTRLKESRRRGDGANVWSYIEKVRDDFYTKRKVLRDGRTEPWLWLEYLAFKDQQKEEGLPRFQAGTRG